MIEQPNGDKEWHLNGKLHRIEREDGSKAWYLNGQYHREDGPAIEYADGTKGWHLNGKIHRIDGPAIEYPNGNKEYWLFGHRVGKGCRLPFPYTWINNLTFEENFRIVLRLFEIHKLNGG